MKTNYQTKKLGEVSEVSAGNSAPQDKSLFKNGIYPFFRTSDIGDIHIGEINKSNDYLNNKGILKMKLFNKGTILIPKSGASTFLNHRVIIGVDGYVSSHLATINVNNNILNNKYLFYFLQEIKAQDLIQDHKYPSLNLPVIENIEIPLPPLTEQKRIVKILDEVFEKLEKVKEGTEKNLASAKELFESYLQNVFANKGKDWEERKLEEVCKVVAGQSPESKFYNKLGIGLPFYQGKKDFGEKFLLKPTVWTTKVTKEAEKGDILMSVRAPVGPTNFAIERICIGRGLSAIKTGNEINRDFLFYFFKIFEDKLVGNSGAVFNSINKTQIENIEIPFPHLIKQKEIVKKLDQLSEETKKLENIYKEKLKDIAELKKSILQKASQGEL